jgi:cob(I)alamin adenosyltransferase
MIQFMKGDPYYGELQAAARLPNFEVRQFGRPDFVDRDNPAHIDIHMAQQALTNARAILVGGQYDVVILDEIIVAVDFGLIELRDVMALIESRDDKTELILTGRSAPREIIQLADLVTEMKEVKHYLQRGIKARDGIEH